MEWRKPESVGATCNKTRHNYLDSMGTEGFLRGSQLPYRSLGKFAQRGQTEEALSGGVAFRWNILRAFLSSC